MFLERLFKKDTNGKIRILDVEIVDNKYRTIHGIIDGELVTSEWTECLPKNIGKNNETNGEQQALFEANAHHQKKLKQHYYLDVDDLDCENSDKYFKVMLAIDKDKIKKFPTFPYQADYKLDGLRLVKGNDFKHSRTGEPLPSSDHLNDILVDFFKSHPEIILDGELYNHSLKHNFEHLMHLARTTKLTNEERIECAEILEFHIYDCFSKISPEIPAYKRKELIDKFVSEINHPSIKIVKTILINNQDELDAFVIEAIANGYEGVILRSPNEPYQNKRTKHLIKVKEFITEEFVIIDVLEGSGNRSGMAGNISVIVDGEECGCGIRGSHKYCVDLLKRRDELIGKTATVRYFGRTEYNSLRFPVCIDVDRIDLIK